MTSYLLELGVEEFPSRFMASTKEQLLSHVLSGLEESHVAVEMAQVQATPRRFALRLDGLVPADTSEDEIIRGPSKKAAYDADGQPTKALQGFLRSKQLREEDTYIEDNGKDEYVFARVKKAAISVEEVLRHVVPQAIRKISNPRAMRWGGKNLRFLRPIRWIVSLLDDAVLPFDLEQIPVGRTTNGHRFLGEKNVEIASVEAYAKTLEEQFVIIDEGKRRDMILRGLNRLAREHGGVPYQNEELLDEVINIVEYPTVFMGEVPTAYLELPPEVVITPMMDHQRYFPVVDEKGALLPYFLSVRNGDAHGIENVIAGNQKVLIPRLEDAKFFYDQDLKKPLDAYVDDLAQLMFHEQLGTMAQKTERLEKLGVSITEMLGCGSDVEETVARAAHLAKADLVTHMVVEFTELEGTMGRIYAERSGENTRVARAIEEHYFPRHAKGALPTTTAGMALSIADKIDTIAGLFAIGITVTGSQDPFGLRRAAIGILEILREKSLSLDLTEAFRDALILYVEQQGLVFDYDEVIGRVNDFFRGRLKTRLVESGIRYDVVDAVLATDDDDFLRLMQKADALDSRLAADGGEALITSFVRIQSMAEKATSREGDFDALTEEDEALRATLPALQTVDMDLGVHHFEAALDALANLMPTVNAYLDHTMILVDDPALQAARLALLSAFDTRIEEILRPNVIVREQKE